MLLEVLDIIALGVDSFEIPGGFKSNWRAHVWEGKARCQWSNLLMLSIRCGVSF